jgi:hypothetical protein
LALASRGLRNVPPSRRVPVSLESEQASPALRDLNGYDYADAFELDHSASDVRSAEDWVRAGLEDAPAIVRWIIRFVHTRVLHFELGPVGDPECILGWSVVHNDPDALRLETDGALLRGAIVAQRPSPTSVALQTFLFFRQPDRARRVWTVVGPLHRLLAPLLLRWAARHG